MDDADARKAEAAAAYGARLTAAMERAGLTRAALAARSGVHDATVRPLVAGTLLPRIETTLKLAAALGVAPGWLAFGDAPAGFFVVTGALRAQPDRDRSVTWRDGSLSGDPLALLLVNAAGKRAGGPAGPPAIFAAQLADPRAALTLILAQFEPGAAVLGDAGG
ncbi:MAG: helix-turn-helix domain-containing protein [Solirubrobacteraceae bacterium]